MLNICPSSYLGKQNVEVPKSMLINANHGDSGD